MLVLTWASRIPRPVAMVCLSLGLKAFYCTLVERRIVMLHSFVKKSQKTPTRELRIAETRMKEIKHADTH